jgi:hypothetical protein
MNLSAEILIFTSSPQAYGEERDPLRKHPYSSSSLRPFIFSLMVLGRRTP